MLKQVRKNIVQNLWERYRQSTDQMRRIEQGLLQKGIQNVLLDHFAIIDLPGPQTGIHTLKQIFLTLGYIEQGKDYLSDKQNDFLWMTEEDSLTLPAKEVLPQVVVADFRLDELPIEIKKTIEKYSYQASPLPLTHMQQLANDVLHDDSHAALKLNELLCHYLAGRDWPLPSISDFYQVQAFNELLAWVLVFGRRPNHFTLSIHLLDHFANLDEFNQFVEKDLNLALNCDGGTIKGGHEKGIAQGSTTGISQKIMLQDGAIEIPTGFVEFVWRYPCAISKDAESIKKPLLWKDYFTGFIAQHADRVIESLYVN